MQASHPVIQPFLNYLKFEKRFSQHTVLAYETDLISFFDYIAIQYGDTPLPQLSHTIIRSWLAQLKEEKLTAKSINRKISTLRSFFKFCLKQGMIAQSPMGKVIAPKNEKRLPQFVSEAHMDTLFNHVEFGDDWQGKTDRLLLLLFYNTGMRLSELIGLRESSFNPANNTVKVLGKGNKERIIPVSSALIDAIKEYGVLKKLLPVESPAENLLVTENGKALQPRAVYAIVKKYLSLVTTIEKRSPHILRHTFATHLTNNGADINAVKELLGHSSLAATQVYTHNTIEKLKNVHQKAHPKA
jgi:integrase/recombinase XerC